MSDINMPSEPMQDPASQPPKKKSKVELLAEIKKLLEKNGLTISDDVLLGLVDSMQIQGMSLSRRLDFFELQQISAVDTTQKILVFPRGKHWIEQYEEWLTYDDKFYQEVEKNFKDRKLNRPYIDKDHEYAESYGDILDYEVNDEGMFFYIRLNQQGMELVRNGIYRYISPSFGDVVDTTKKQHKNWMVTISLTNNPAFLGVIPALQEQIKLKLKKPLREGKMELRKLANFLELQEEASPEAILQAVQEISAKLQEAQDLITKLTGETEQKDQKIDEQQAAMTAMNKDLTEIKTEKLEKEADEIIKLAVEKGQYCVNEKFLEMKKKEYILSPEKIKMELELIPVQENKKTLTKNNHEFTNLKLEEDELENLKSLGYDLENKDHIELIKKVYEKEEK